MHQIDTTEHKHTKKARFIQKQILMRNGFEVSFHFLPTVGGEFTSINIYDKNLYPDSDSRSGSSRELTIPFVGSDELKQIVKALNEILKEREKTLIKKKKKR